MEDKEIQHLRFRYCNTVYNQITIERRTKGYILPFLKKGDLRITKNYRGITYLGSRITSTENDINIGLAKALTAIEMGVKPIR